MVGPENTRGSGLMGALRLVGVAIIWLLCERLLATFLGPALPASIAKHFSYASWMISVEILAALIGFGAALVLVKPLPRALGLSAPGAFGLGAALVIAPLVSLVALYVSNKVALPILIEEVRTAGRQATQAKLGAFGAGIREASTLELMLWVVVIAPLSEELMFRGALWGGIQAAIDKLRGKSANQSAPDEQASPSSVQLPVSDPAALKAARKLGAMILGGGITTLLVTVIFSLLHSTYEGGLGIQRSIAATVLALVLGVARQWGGNLFAPILLHAGFNLLDVARNKGWLVSESFPLKPMDVVVTLGEVETTVSPKVLPSLLIYLGLGGGVLALVLGIVAFATRKR